MCSIVIHNTFAQCGKLYLKSVKDYAKNMLTHYIQLVYYGGITNGGIKRNESKGFINRTRT